MNQINSITVFYSFLHILIQNVTREDYKFVYEYIEKFFEYKFNYPFERNTEVIECEQFKDILKNKYNIKKTKLLMNT